VVGVRGQHQTHPITRRFADEDAYVGKGPDGGGPTESSLRLGDTRENLEPLDPVVPLAPHQARDGERHRVGIPGAPDDPARVKLPLTCRTASHGIC